MLFRKERGIALTLALAATFGLGFVMARSARADGMLIFQHTIPREVDAYDFRTGGPYMAPPVPYGHYAKDYVDELHKCIGCATCQLHGLMGGIGCGHGGCGHGGCGHGGCGHGGGGHGAGCAHGAGIGHGAGLGQTGGVVEGSGFGPVNSGYVSDGSGIGGGGNGMIANQVGAYPGAIAGAQAIGNGMPAGYANTWAPPTSEQGVAITGQAACGQAGCAIGAKHWHLSPSSMASAAPCGSCGGAGCGACRGTAGVGSCGVAGCSLGAAHSHGNGVGSGHGGGTGCHMCGGKGCANCLAGLGGLASGLHGKLASLGGLFNKPKISWFNGAGGPVPITPGYVPYIVSTRSPRDFFSFAPMNPNDR